MISVWGGCSKELLESLQKVQNRAARVITKNDWSVGTKENLKQIGWLSVHQLVQYHDILLLHKVIKSGQPRNLHNMDSYVYLQQTRQATSGAVKPIGIPKLDIAKNSFRWRAAETYNKIPLEVIKMEDSNKFKKEIKSWIMNNSTIRR